MKRYIVILLLFIISLSSYSQMWGIPNLTTFDDKKIHFGFTLGVNTLDLGFSHYNTLFDNPNFDKMGVDPSFLTELDSVAYAVRADVSGLMPGFTVGIVTNLRLKENLDLRFIPGLSFGSR
ncbi:MAG TPA: hypothetical protein VJY41_02490, partial [Prolixibacteraceae bacterium]|nr:hypothetical protein [Prolixibacteraceae bacterium]